MYESGGHFRFSASISAGRPTNRSPLFDRFCAACEDAEDDLDQLDRLTKGLDAASDATLAFGAATDATLSYGLCLAVKAKNVPAVRYLLKNKAKVTRDALRLNRTTEIFELFRELTSWDVNDQYKGLGCLGGTILPSIIMLNDEQLTRWFLDNGADPSLCTENCLEIAAVYSTPTVLDLLIQHGCKLQNCHPLHHMMALAYPPWRTAQERASMIAHLVKLGCDINEIEDDFFGGTTPLHLAVLAGMVCEVQSLVENGADVLVRNRAGSIACAAMPYFPSEETMELIGQITRCEAAYRRAQRGSLIRDPEAGGTGRRLSYID